MRTFLILFSFILIFTAEARVRIDLSSPTFNPLPIAVSDIHGQSTDEMRFGQQVAEVIRANLTNSTPFDVVDPEAYLQDAPSLNFAGPRYQDWRVIGSDAILTGVAQLITVGGEAKLRVEYRLFDAHDEKQLLGKRYTVDPKFWRHIAHRVSDDVYQELTGEEGYFTTRIVHIGEEPDETGQLVKKLCVMDQDGASYQCLTDGSHLVLTPRYNRDLQKVIYMSYASGLPRLYLLDLPTGQQTIVGDFEGLNSSPRFSPDSKTVAMTLTKGHAGNPEIYSMNLRNRRLRRLTYHRAIDTSPDYSPDGDEIVFNSTRGGSPALYIMDDDGGNVRRLTFGKGRYYAPVWSPRGDLIAFVKELNGTFHIGVIDPDGQEERLLTDSYLDESPTWSPNGRVISFARQKPDTNEVTIWAIDLTGYNLRQIPTPTNASDPAWSPLIK